MIINNYSVHQFILPFTSDSFKIDKSIWIKNKDYYYSTNDEYGVDETLVKIKRFNSLKYFNNSALRLLGKDNRESLSTISTLYTNSTIGNNKTLRITGTNNEQFDLHILNVSLTQTLGIKVLRIVASFDYNNYKNKLEDKKKAVKFVDAFNIINDLGRRIYLPNIAFYTDEKKETVSAVPSNIPKSVAILNDGKDELVVENFDPKINNAGKYNSKIIKYLLTGKQDGINFESCLDDRMFVCSSIVNDSLKTTITANKYNDKQSELLYKTIFIDGYDVSCPNVNKRNEDLNNSIYSRWNTEGTIYGITNYSFISIFNKLKDVDFLLENSVNMYADMATIALIERAAAMHYVNKDDRKLKDSLEIDINNTVYLKEISEQLQGIELFDMLREQMKLDENIEHLKNKLDLIHNQKQERASDLLNIFMTAFSIIALIPIKEEIKSIMLGTEIIAILATLGLSMFLENKFRIKLSTYLLLAIIAIVYIFNIIM